MQIARIIEHALERVLAAASTYAAPPRDERGAMIPVSHHGSTDPQAAIECCASPDRCRAPSEAIDPRLAAWETDGGRVIASRIVAARSEEAAND